jgi:hypothetical protein
MYLNKISNILINSNYNSIIPAPDWRLLIEYGGHLTIEEFRKNFNNIEYKNHGIIKKMFSVGRLYEKKFKI